MSAFDKWMRATKYACIGGYVSTAVFAAFVLWGKYNGSPVSTIGLTAFVVCVSLGVAAVFCLFMSDRALTKERE